MAGESGAVFTFLHDGLTLAGRLWGDPETARRSHLLPIICLPGLTRNARDFAALATAITATDPRRLILAFDYRGRGLSDPAAGPDGYTVAAEAADTLAGLDHLQIDRAVFVGTSRGALIIHSIAAMRLAAIAGVVFNDAGPRLELEGLRHIRDTVGIVESFAGWDEAIDAVAKANAPRFPALSQADFARMARAGFVEHNGRIFGDYDRRLLEPLRTMDLDNPLPELWAAFDLLKGVPLLVIRGETSKLFTAETVATMSTRHPSLEAIVVRGQGHAPLLETGRLPGAILDLVTRAEAASAGSTER
ncbi:alpha/beta hydrolase [Jiella sp. MQZ9-1]|uniref:Alpha/beta hydrolase n=1 Tax=Jiella flava TaxID=2816857 RepID=A0A939FZS6_9HYPH|nr:alpha/beta hydrolase [Jiella flava]MBO0663206.1 alpha/beta hydrolase [Jiella flava]MCD2471781.1 alpha/beta hydrolase [Jiella flava]